MEHVMTHAYFLDTAPYEPIIPSDAWIMGHGCPDFSAPWHPDQQGLFIEDDQQMFWIKEGTWRHEHIKNLPLLVEWQQQPVALMAESHLHFPEISRYLAQHRAMLFIVVGEAPRSDYRSGLWREVQQNQVMALTWWPHPGLLVPCEMDPTTTGFIPAVSYHVQWEWSQVIAIRERYPLWQRRRPDLYRSHWWITP